MRSFCYQLQEADLAQLQQSNFDLMILDYSRDGTAAGRWTSAEISTLQRHPRGSRRLVLAYLSIGEAENYRFYWQKGFRPGQPGWLDKSNPNWPNNFKVRYWDKSWQAILFGNPQAYLDQILEAGFDGIYLDIVDAYEYYEERGRGSASQEMVQLITNLAKYGRQRGGADFGVFTQNGEALWQKSLLATITGVGREDTYFGYEAEGRPSPLVFTRTMETRLDAVVKAGKIVLNVDYTANPKQVKEAYHRALQHSYLEYTTTRGLDRLWLWPGLQPPKT